MYKITKKASVNGVHSTDYTFSVFS